MVFATYEELQAAVEKRRSEILTLEVDLGTDYSPEYEAAKKELEMAKAMKTVTGGGFLGDNIAPLEAKVEELRPQPNSVFIQFRKLELGQWAKLLTGVAGNQIDQFERTLPDTFIGIYGTDPVKPDDAGDDWVKPEPLSTDAALLSSKGNQGILPGGALNAVIQNFMAWQNSGGDVTIRPTKSGLV
jgi:hypothetical protein